MEKKKLGNPGLNKADLLLSPVRSLALLKVTWFPSIFLFHLITWGVTWSARSKSCLEHVYFQVERRERGGIQGEFTWASEAEVFASFITLMTT